MFLKKSFSFFARHGLVQTILWAKFDVLLWLVKPNLPGSYQDSIFWRRIRSWRGEGREAIASKQFLTPLPQILGSSG